MLNRGLPSFRLATASPEVPRILRSLSMTIGGGLTRGQPYQHKINPAATAFISNNSQDKGLRLHLADMGNGKGKQSPPTFHHPLNKLFISKEND